MKTTLKKKAVTSAVIIGSSGAALALGIIGGAAIATATDKPPLEVSLAQLSVDAVERFPTGSTGLTYGYVDQGLTTDPDARADLVLATTDDGKEGWVYFRELQPAHFASTTEEALRVSTDEPYAVAVYELDGKTLIGYHTVNRPRE